MRKAHVILSNRTKTRINKIFIKKVVNFLLTKKFRKFLPAKLEINFISSKEISKINEKYRQINKPTNVLSFSYLKDSRKRNFIAGKKRFLELGEIFIDPKVLKREAFGAKISFNKRLVQVLIHGILHIFGYDHEGNKTKRKIMEKLENKLEARLKKFYHV